MKKFSTEYFEKKYRILFNKLLQKQGFLESVKEVRRKLGIPEGGFNNEAELARFLIGKMSNNQKSVLMFAAFADDFCSKNKINPLEDEGKEKLLNAYAERMKKNKIDDSEMVFKLAGEISDHNEMITKNPYFRGLLRIFITTRLRNTPKSSPKLKQSWHNLLTLTKHIMSTPVFSYTP